LLDRDAIQNVPRRVSYQRKHTPDLAGCFGFAIGAAPISNSAKTRERRNWAVDNPKDAAESDLIRRHEKNVAAEATTSARYNAVMLEVQKDLLEELAGDLLLLGNLRDHHGIVGAGQSYKRPERVSGFLRDHCFWREGYNPY
jgi:hypothetical protein